MSLSEHFQGLDPKIAEALQRAVDGLRTEFRALLAEARGESVPRDEIAAEPEEASEASVEPVLSTASGDGFDVLEELKHAVAYVDRAATQGEVLDALLAGARRFSSRSALFVLRSSSFEGWGGSGFGAVSSPLQSLQLDPPGDSPWARLPEGKGGVPLGPDDCALLCDAIGAERPTVGVLLPLVLGDRVAGALYGDRIEGNGSLEISALQLLTYNAGQVLETLPVRNRETTATLRIAAAVNAFEEQVAAVDLTEAEPAVAEPAARVIVEEKATVEELVTEIDERPEEEPEQTSAAADPGDVAIFEDESEELGTRAMVPPLPAREPSPAETATFEPLSSPPGTELEEWPAPSNLLDSGEELSTTLEPAEIEEIPYTPTPEAEPTPEPAEPPRPTAEVRPPSDLEGPGWAFTQRRGTSELGEEALHEEARRLARLLVTEIKLYNEEQVGMGRQHRDLHSRLREDIERSRQIYADRIDGAVRDKKDYFQEALVRILAGGDAGALGA
jgi:hypothetical protein